MKFLCIVALVAFSAFATTRTETSKIVIPDTSIVKVRGDTLKFVVYDTLRITKTLKDTTLLVKTDTVKTSSKPIEVLAPKAPTLAPKAPAKK